MKTLLRAQGLAIEQTMYFLFSAIKGDARREVRLLEGQQRDTADKIFDFLQGLYGGQTTTANLRINFFNVKQGMGETLGDFSLRLREAFQKWGTAEPDGSAHLQHTLRDQMMLGLQSGSLKELQRQVHRSPNLTFSELLQKANELEREGWAEEGDGLS